MRIMDSPHMHVHVFSPRLTKAEHVLSDLVEVVGLSLLGGVYYDDGGSEDGQQTTHLAVQVESLLQQVGRQHRTVWSGT